MEQQSDRSSSSQNQGLGSWLRRTYMRLPQRSRRGLFTAVVMALALATYAYWTTTPDPASPTSPTAPDGLTEPRVVVVQDGERLDLHDQEEPAAAGIPAALMWPVQGRVLAEHGWINDQTMGDWRFHSGIDIAAPLDEPVTATAAGTVEKVELDGAWGWTVTIEHAPGYYSRYANLATVSIAAGTKVAAGDTIGTVGESSRLEAGLEPHLHFELIWADKPANPLEFMPAGS